MNGVSIAMARVFSLFRSRLLVRDTIRTTMLSTIGKVGMGLIPFFIAAWFGISPEMDVFFFAYGIIIFLGLTFSPVVETIIVPFLAELKAKDEKEVGPFIGSILMLTPIGLTLFGVIFLVVVNPILNLVTHFSPTSLSLLSRLLVEISPFFILLTLSSILTGALNAYRFFSIPALSPALKAIAILVIIFFFKETIGVHAIAAGYVLGELFRFALLFIIIRKYKIFPINFSLKLHPKLMELLKTASFLIFGMVAVGLNPIIDKTMASWLGPGSVSILEYAERLYSIPLSFLSAGFIVTILSHWSDNFYIHGKSYLVAQVKKTVKIIALLSLVISVGLMLLKHPIVNLVYGRGKYPIEMLGTTELLFFYYLFGFIPYMVARVYVRYVLVLRNTKIFFYIALIKNAANILLDWILMNIFGVVGIALSSTGVSLIEMVGFMYFVNKLSKDSQ